MNAIALFAAKPFIFWQFLWKTLLLNCMQICQKDVKNEKESHINEGEEAKRNIII